MAQLSEVPVGSATGPIAKIYDEIKYRSGAAVPALLFRHLASRPPLLEWLWTIAGPRFIDGTIQAAAQALVSDINAGKRLDLQSQKLQALGITSSDCESVQSVLDTYNRMNPMNLLTIQLCLRVLDQGAEAIAAVGQEVAPPDRLPDVPAAVPLHAMHSDTRQLTEELAQWIPASAYGSITPTLYRHLANWPGFLALVGSQLLDRLQDGSIQRTTETLQEISAELVAQLPATAAPWSLTSGQQSEVRAAIDPFFVCIPQLIVVGKLISESL
jgi:hypothetical protein